MSTKLLPAPEALRQLLCYKPDTGKLYWRERTPDMFKRPSQCKSWNKIYAEKEALYYVDNCGYKRGSVLNKVVLAHVAAYAIYFGIYPDNTDHINGDRSDNRIQNLRSVSKRENSLNRKINSNNTSGYVGVAWLRHSQRWQARVKIHGRQISLGCFANFDDAVKVRKKAEAKYGFHPNHGRR